MKKKEIKKIKEAINEIIDSLEITELKIERIQKYIEKNIDLQVDLWIEFDKNSIIDKLKN